MLSVVRAIAIVLALTCVTVIAFADDYGEYSSSIVYPDGKKYSWTRELIGNTPEEYFVTNDSQVNNEDVLYIDTIASPSYYISYARDLNVDDDDKIIVEATMRLDDYTGNTYYGGCRIKIATENKVAVLIFNEDKIHIHITGKSYSMNTTDTYHTYKMVADGLTDTVDVFLYNTTTSSYDLVIDDADFISNLGETNTVVFGDGSLVASSASSWRNIKYSVESQ
jgi:hypothetical protein